jgi:hypothetical protein
VDEEVLYVSRGLDVMATKDGGDTLEPFATCPGSLAETWGSQMRVLSRLGRLGVHALRPLPDGGTVAVLRRRVVWCPSGARQFREVLRIDRGSRPLNLCRTSGGRMYFGEYFGNPNRDAVHIYGSGDGQRWSVVHTFPAGAVRHIHNVVEDPYRGGVWVLTGDSDEESGLWFTKDRFQTLDRVFGGTQRARAVSLIPLRRGLIVPTDTPQEQNYVQWGNPETGELTPVAPLPNSAFHASERDGILLVSTTAEPSPCNDTAAAHVFVSPNGIEWHRFDSFRRDWSFLRGRHSFIDRAVRHPEIELVPGDNNTSFIFGYGRGIRGADGRLLRWTREQVLDCIREDVEQGLVS